MDYWNELCQANSESFTVDPGTLGNATKGFMDASGIWKVEVQDDAKPIPMNEANPRTKIHPAPNVNSAEAEKLSPTSLRIISSEVYT